MTCKEAKEYIDSEYLQYTIPSKRAEQGVDRFEKWLALSREHNLEAYIHWLQAMVYIEKKQYEEAAAEQEKALNLFKTKSFVSLKEGL